MSQPNNGNGRFVPDMNQYVTFKWLMGAAVGLCLGGAVVTASAMVYMNTQFEKKAAKSRLETIERNYTDDIKWIKECMIKKCWDKPPPPP